MQWMLNANREPIPIPTGLAWARWMHQEGQSGGLRVIARDEWDDGTFLSTIFIGVDMSFGMGPPLLWESMAFYPDDRERPQRRYASKEEALAGHEEMFAEIQADGVDRGPLTLHERWVPAADALTS